ncbi:MULTISPECIES: hypothetical protein [Streptomyces]|uniref:Uncharacterized protein n=1 Tax=Streptomyces lycii TaxID=2654337 RepID=A0ABQ7FL41_9ACTN|nr:MULTISPECIES: hypothetical protein [Streptomyces]KAF4409390.1 hypothetical protein GCU69_09285 [Streptomyces lycii]PGH51319.1 hypothetical protein CRI70_07285 [Streptomyces sp. Ru87]
MAYTAERAVIRARGRRILDTVGVRESGTRHPLVAAVMVLPFAVLLTVVFGGWEAVVTQASSVAGMLGR